MTWGAKPLSISADVENSFLQFKKAEKTGI